MKALTRRMRHRVIGWGVLSAGVAATAHLGLLRGAEWGRSWANGADFIGRMFPPDPSTLGTLTGALLQTIEIAFAGTLIGFVVSLPLGCLADRSLFGPIIAVPARVLIGAIRSVPSIIYGLIAVVIVGLGAKAGVIAVAAYTVGYLAKFYYETFEAADPEVIEALRGIGAGRLQVFWHGVLPETANQVLSQLIFMFEYNIRASTIMGFVGAGGIGYYMMGYAQMLQYRSLMTALLLTFAVVVAVDAASFRIRKSFSYAVGRKS